MVGAFGSHWGLSPLHPHGEPMGTVPLACTGDCPQSDEHEERCAHGREKYHCR